MEDVRDRRKFQARAGQAAEYLGVSAVTLRKMEKGEDLAPHRTPRGHRRYSLEMLEQFIESNRRSNASRK